MSWHSKELLNILQWNKTVPGSVHTKTCVKEWFDWMINYKKNHEEFSQDFNNDLQNCLWNWLYRLSPEVISAQWGQDTMVKMLHKTFSNIFFCITSLLNFTDICSYRINNKSWLVQKMAWAKQAWSHYLNHCWLGSQIHTCLTRCWWFNSNLVPHITRYVDGTPTSEVTPVTIWCIHPPHHGYP